MIGIDLVLPRYHSIQIQHSISLFFLRAVFMQLITHTSEKSISLNVKLTPNQIKSSYQKAQSHPAKAQIQPTSSPTIFSKKGQHAEADTSRTRLNELGENVFDLGKFALFQIALSIRATPR